MASKNSELVLHKLTGTHKFIDKFNAEAYETEQVCTVCGFVKNTKPGNVENVAHLTDAFRYGMVSASEALKAMGIETQVKELEAKLKGIV
jgi:3-oxoacyl-(acyl-carrier-protein) synthase